MLKTQAVQELVKVFGKWQASIRTFEQDVALEMRDAGRNYVNTYLTMVNRISQGEFNAVIDSPIVATAGGAHAALAAAGATPSEQNAALHGILSCEHFAHVPNLWLESQDVRDA